MNESAEHFHGSRELDKLVAKHVMNWGGVSYASPGRHPSGVYDGTKLMGYPIGASAWHLVPAYSTYAVMWEVVDEMRRKGYGITIKQSDDVDGGQTNVWFRRNSLSERADGWGQHLHLPFALCLAAIAACQMEEA